MSVIFELDDGVKGRHGLQGPGQLLITQYMAKGFFRKEFKGVEGHALLEHLEHFHGGFHMGHPEQHDRGVPGRTGQCHGYLHHQSQGAFGPNKQVAEVVTGVVLGQSQVQGEQFTAPGHHFHAHHPVSGHAIANHLDAPGIGGHIATDLTRTGRGKVHRVIKPLFQGELLQLPGDHSGLTGHQPVNGIEGQNPVHAVKGNHHFAAGGHRAAAEAGSSPGRYQGKSPLIGQSHQGHHVLHTAG